MRGQRQHRPVQETPNHLLVSSSRASSFTRCLLNEADGRQAGPPSLVIGVRAATKPECFYLRAPGSTSIPSIRILGEPRKPNFCAMPGSVISTLQVQWHAHPGSNKKDGKGQG